MFSVLIESRHARQRHDGGTLVSLAVHATLVTLALQLTVGAARQFEAPRVERLVFTMVKSEAPPASRELPRPIEQPVLRRAMLPARGFQVLAVPVKVPTALPMIDLRAAATRGEDFSGQGVAGGVALGVVGGTARHVVREQPYFASEVEKPATPLAENRAPDYPEQLRALNIEGVAVVQFVIDTTGRADPASFRVLRTAHEGFAQAVRTVLPHWRFHPAEVGGRKVRVLVQQPIEFTLAP